MGQGLRPQGGLEVRRCLPVRGIGRGRCGLVIIMIAANYRHHHRT